MKTTNLKYTPDFKFQLIGVSTIENDYRFAWQLINLLNIEISRCPDLKITDGKSPDEQIFSLFENTTKTEDFKLKIYSNKGNNTYLIPEYKHFDYLLAFSGELNIAGVDNADNETFISTFKQKLKTLENISILIEIKDFDKIKSIRKINF